jgi:hypothetical protein
MMSFRGNVSRYFLKLGRTAWISPSVLTIFSNAKVSVLAACSMNLSGPCCNSGQFTVEARGAETRCRAYPNQPQNIRLDLNKSINHAAKVLEHSDQGLNPPEPSKRFCRGLLLLDGEGCIKHVVGGVDFGEVKRRLGRQTAEKLLLCRGKGFLDPGRGICRRSHGYVGAGISPS